MTMTTKQAHIPQKHRVELKLRIPKEIHTAIECAAALARRSMNLEITTRLRRSFVEDRLGTIDSRLARIEKALKPWQPIETAPRGEEILLGDAINGISIGFYYCGRWMDTQLEYACAPTHWMPLPERPDNVNVAARLAAEQH